MKIRPISDIHLEFSPFHLAPAGEDILIVAGDVALHTDHMEILRAAAKFLNVPVVVVAGNHEFYSHPPDDTHTWDSTLSDLRAAADHTDKIVNGEVTFFENSFAVYEGVRFIGATLWTDMKLYGDDLFAVRQIERSMNDYNLIRTGNRKKLKVHEVVARHHASRQFITDRLAETFDGPTVVVTHHAPSWLSIHPDYRANKVSAAYASRLEPLILSYDPVLWIHGHTHFSFDYEIGSTRIVCNPRGYNDENKDFDPNLIIEIERVSHDNTPA